MSRRVHLAEMAWYAMLGRETLAPACDYRKAANRPLLTDDTSLVTCRRCRGLLAASVRDRLTANDDGTGLARSTVGELRWDDGYLE